MHCLCVFVCLLISCILVPSYSIHYWNFTQSWEISASPEIEEGEGAAAATSKNEREWRKVVKNDIFTYGKVKGAPLKESNSFFVPLYVRISGCRDSNMITRCQGWKMHYQPPNNDEEINFSTLAIKLTEGFLAKKVFFKVLKPSLWKETLLRPPNLSDPTSTSWLDSFLFGKLFTFYDLGQTKKIFEVITSIVRSIPSHIPPGIAPPFDCIMDGTPPGVSFRFGRLQAIAIKKRKRYSILQNHLIHSLIVTDFNGKVRRDDGYWMHAPSITTVKKNIGAYPIFENDLRPTSRDSALKLTKRTCACMPEFVLAAPPKKWGLSKVTPNIPDNLRCPLVTALGAENPSPEFHFPPTLPPTPPSIWRRILNKLSCRGGSCSNGGALDESYAIWWWGSAL